ncbi:MAG: hypothetical protein AAGA72_00490 [Pseudomonadota bacterium]
MEVCQNIDVDDTCPLRQQSYHDAREIAHEFNIDFSYIDDLADEIFEVCFGALSEDIYCSRYCSNNNGDIKSLRKISKYLIKINGEIENIYGSKVQYILENSFSELKKNNQIFDIDEPANLVREMVHWISQCEALFHHAAEQDGRATNNVEFSDFQIERDVKRLKVFWEETLGRKATFDKSAFDICEKEPDGLGKFGRFVFEVIKLRRTEINPSKIAYRIGEEISRD